MRSQGLGENATPFVTGMQKVRHQFRVQMLIRLQKNRAYIRIRQLLPLDVGQLFI